MKSKLFLFVFAILVNSIFCQIKLPSIIGSNMVLQQKSEAPLWGKGVPNTEIEINAGWGENVRCKVGTDSLWEVKIKTPNAGGPFSIKITSNKNKIELTNILIGEVWLCSGQSNMEMPLEGWPPRDIILNSSNEIANSKNNNIRFFTVSRDFSVSPKDNCTGEWVECNPTTSKTFSATAYFFGKKLNKELDVPIGLIHSSWGGTLAEAWTSQEFISKIPEFEGIQKKIKESGPIAIELSKWLSQFKKIDMSKKVGDDIWSNLEFDDDDCSKINLNDKGWEIMELPNLWESTDLGEFDGAIWFRKNIELPNDWLNKDLQIELGPIDDFDITFVNGVKVGAIEKDGNYQTKRIYKISSSVNNSKNILIAVRVNDTRGGGGIYGNKDELKLVNLENNSALSIAGEWKYLPVAEFKGMTYFVYGSNSETFNSRPKLPLQLSANTPTVLYNAMINPLVPYKIKGVIWYQGESNAGNPQLYETLFPTMITNWRLSFSDNFPFYYTQIAPYNYGENTKSEFLRDAQRKTLSLGNTGMAVTLDIGDTTNIHPADKKDVGERLAFWALNKQYDKNIIYSGPLFKSYSISNGKIEIEFDNTGSGLNIKEGKNQFLIADESRKFVNAKSKIENNKLIVWCDKIKNPLAVRYAWHNNAQATLFNNEGLPASSFRTDDWVK
ncbi:MAG: glycosyl hydrolase family 2 [Ignavibacteriae bacterium]|nr:glycosyl hydrolase family 2 [Ignavibacteriota bacterium]